jgi:hypothetical protein
MPLFPRKVKSNQKFAVEEVKEVRGKGGPVTGQDRLTILGRIAGRF